ncbi:MAG: cysteine desulfurase family protein [Lentisphaeria bacterium]
MPQAISSIEIAKDNSGEPSFIYLDHAAAAPLKDEVVGKHAERCRDLFFNPHSTHQYSENCIRAIESAKEKLLALLGISKSEAEVVWTSGGTESNNLAILGCTRELRGKEATVLVERAAHSSVLAPARACVDDGARYLEVPVDGSGLLDLTALEGNPDLSQVLLALCHVNNETGACQDLTAVRKWLDRNAADALFVVDALQSFTKLDIAWHEAGIDMLSLGGRKIGGPPHVGALVVRRGTPLKPLMFGGGQQKGLRPGTVDTVGIVEFVDAAEAASRNQHEKFERISGLRKYLEDNLRNGEFGAPIMLSAPDSSPYICNFALPGYEGAIVMRSLAEKNIIIATGSACSAESASTSHVLAAMGVDRRTARSALRISFGDDTTETTIDRFLDSLREVLENY